VFGVGVQLGDIVSKEKIEIEQLRGRTLAIDAMNSLYQFLAIIRQRGGELLRDSKGRVTSHLSGLFYRTANLIEIGIQPIYVYDGEPPKLKRRTVEEGKLLRDGQPLSRRVKWMRLENLHRLQVSFLMR
jgi:flap endonuclease-1